MRPPTRLLPALYSAPTTLALTALLALAALPAGAEPVRTIEQVLTLQGATAVQVKFPVGDLEVTGGGGETVAATIDLKCPAAEGGRCRNAAERVLLEVRRNGRWLVLELEGFPSARGHDLSAEVRLTLPRALAFQADLGVGDVHVRGLENDVEVDVGVGDVELTLPAAKVRAVELDAGVGEAELVIGGSRVSGSGLVGKGLDWSQGEGAAHVEVDCGVGDIEVVLEK